MTSLNLYSADATFPIKDLDKSKPATRFVKTLYVIKHVINSCHNSLSATRGALLALSRRHLVLNVKFEFRTRSSSRHGSTRSVYWPLVLLDEIYL